jgi:hypothetical protein
VYLEIGSLLPDELSVFVDSASVPDILPHRYKISIVDTCGSESELSAYHQTMHLTANLSINKDVNLIWSEYMGIPFQAYVIYRGNHPDSITFLIQVPSTVTSFTDDDPPAGMIYYQVGMSNPAGCLPAKKSLPDYSISRSNTEEVLNPTGIVNVNEDDPFMIYPNPADDKYYILFDLPSESFTEVELYTISGKKGRSLVNERLVKGRHEFELYAAGLANGLYIIRLRSDAKTVTQILSVQH